MSFSVRKLNNEDYDDTLVGWWKSWRWKPIPRDFLPENGEGGVIVYDGDVPVCAGFTYLTNSKVGWIEFIVSNYEYKDKEKRKEALDLLIKTLENILKLSKCKYAYTILKSKSLIGLYKGNNFTEGDSNGLEMIKHIQPCQ